MTTQTIRALQALVHWPDANYTGEFQRNEQAHKRFDHALKHVRKAQQKLDDLCEKSEHRAVALTSERVAEDEKHLLDVVICAMRAANVHPAGPIDLAVGIEARIRGKQRITPEPSPAEAAFEAFVAELRARISEPSSARECVPCKGEGAVWGPPRAGITAREQCAECGGAGMRAIRVTPEDAKRLLAELDRLNGR